MSSKHPLSDEDKAAFRDAVNGISPWDDDKEDPESQDRSQPPANPWISLDHIPDSDWVDGENIIHFTRSGVSPKQLKQLANGKVKFERTLDFHGYNTEELHHELTPAIHRAKLNHIRTLLVVHGKGRQDRADRPAILKNYINQSLRQNTDVLAFHSAQPAHGGSGAIYVLLRGRNNV